MFGIHTGICRIDEPLLSLTVFNRDLKEFLGSLKELANSGEPTSQLACYGLSEFVSVLVALGF